MNVPDSAQPIKGFDGYYVTNDGRVWSARQTGRWLKPHKTECGYFTVGMRSNNKRFRKFVHRLVAEAWIPNPNNLSQVNHIDENKTNNRVENLEWCDPAYNSNYGTRNLRISKPIINIETGERFQSTLEASKKYGIASSAIYGVCNHRPHRFTAGGFHWKYESEVA